MIREIEMNSEHKERLIKLLDEYCDKHGCTLIEDKYNCNEDCPFDCYIDYCPIVYIQYLIKKEVKNEHRT